MVHRSPSRGRGIRQIRKYYWVSGLCPSCSRAQNFLSSAEKELISVTGHWFRDSDYLNAENKKKSENIRLNVGNLGVYFGYLKKL